MSQYVPMENTPDFRGEPPRKKNGAVELQNHLEMLRKRHLRGASEWSGEGQRSGVREKQEDLSTTLLTYWDVIQQRWWVVLILAIGLGALIYQWRKSQPKQYVAHTIVEVVAQSPRVFTNIRDVVSYHFELQRFYATQQVVLTSNTMAQKALLSVPWVLQTPGFFGLERVSDPVKRRRMMEKMRPTAYEILKTKTKIQPIRKSSLFRIVVQDSDPHRASELSLAIAEAYQEYNRLFRLRTTINAYNKIKSQRDRFEERYKELQANLIKFRQDNDLLTTSLTDRRSLAFKRLEAVYQQMMQVMLRRISLESQIRPFISKEGKLLVDKVAQSFPPLLKNELYWKLRAKYGELQLEKESLLNHYKINHPNVQRVILQMKRLHEILDNQITLVVATFQEELRATRREELSLRSRVVTARLQLKSLEKLNLIFEGMLERDKELKRSLDFLNKQFFEVQLLKDATATNVRIVERAIPPKIPFSPRPIRDTVLGSMIGFVVFLGLFVLLEFMDRTVRSMEDVERKAGLTPLGEFPMLTRKKKQDDLELLYNPERPLSIVEESVRAIRTNVMFMASQQTGLRKVLVTSPLPREGKTFMAINLAIGIAHAGRKTILVDTDMRRPRVHKVLRPNFDRSKGVSSVIIGQNTLDEAMVKTKYPNLWVLPCGPIPPSPTELLQTEGFFRMMDELLERFDTVLFDSPPIAQVADGAVLASYMDGVILVSSCGSTNYSSLRGAGRKIESVGGRVLGCILNKFSPKGRRGYYGYGGYYSPYRYKHYGYADPEEEI